MDAADGLLVEFLDAQRGRVFEVLDGLGDEELRRAVLPSGWAPLGLVEHLGHAERHWFQQVTLGAAEALPWERLPEDDADGPFTTSRSTEAVFGFYRRQIAVANEVLVSTSFDAAPVGKHGFGPEPVELRVIVLHMIEETARHLGHLDAARELIDGAVELGRDQW
ncbi:DinB family protein [Kribbella sp. NPDC051770]|uniref:DinB family protein n=1 Tax=Kribbella sp. NPDC051770 TaxID=3155413 RepID=UPI0034278B02